MCTERDEVRSEANADWRRMRDAKMCSKIEKKRSIATSDSTEGREKERQRHLLTTFPPPRIESFKRRTKHSVENPEEEIINITFSEFAAQVLNPRSVWQNLDPDASLTQPLTQADENAA